MSYDSILRSRTNRQWFVTCKEGGKAFTVRVYTRRRDDGRMVAHYGNCIHAGPLNTRARDRTPAPYKPSHSYLIRIIPK